MWYTEFTRPTDQRSDENKASSIDMERMIGDWVKSTENEREATNVIEMANSNANQYF